MRLEMDLRVESKLESRFVGVTLKVTKQDAAWLLVVVKEKS